MTDTDTRQAERRRHERLATSAPARLGLLGYDAEGTLENVSAGGARFSTYDADLVVAPGNFVYVQFEARRGGRPVSIRQAVRVVYVIERHEGDRTLRVLGLEFDSVVELDGLELGS